MTYQSLYRRFRPRRFADIKGQDHIVTALQNSVRENRVGHAYLFSGPRGTGKTTSARVLAKVLNCANPVDGEPCLECESCKSIEAGTSFDVHELDAASNNKVDDIRDLIERVAFATPGRTKLYILDEVHMLTASASAALLKTLEEPPPGVVFVLATTDPQKVIPTIRSRTQHFEFHLLPAAPLEEYVRHVVDEAGLDVTPDAIDHAVRAGNGSARDALSALEQVVAAGGVAEREISVDELVEGLIERDSGRVLVAVADAVNVGRDPRLLGQQLVIRLRDVFLGAMKAPLDHLADADRERVDGLVERFDRPFITRCIEVLGDALAAMVDAVDQRIVLEAALIRLASLEVDTSPAALLERIERLERALASGTAPAPSTAPAAAAPPPAQRTEGPAAAGRRAITPTAITPTAIASTASTATASPSPASVPSAAVLTRDLPSRDDLTLAWGDELLAKIPRAAKARYTAGRFVEVGANGAVFAVPNAPHMAKCEEFREAVEHVLADHFGRPVPLVLTVDTVAVPPPAAPTKAAAATRTVTPRAVEEPEEIIDVHDLEDAPADDRTSLDQLADAFPGAELLPEDNGA
ncbi:MAG: polymerase subunit gamma/tau [Acidimicrobiaceae bacterium]|jgi:DNA polymerase-3 subunit gamma/tau